MRAVRWSKLAGLFAICVLAAACAKGSSSSSSRELSIVSPQGGATVTSPVPLTLSVKGAEIGPPETGKMHFHVHIDGSSQYAVVTSLSSAVQVPNGRHTLKIVLAQPNHDETATSASVTITVSSGGASPSPSGYQY